MRTALRASAEVCTAAEVGRSPAAARSVARSCPAPDRSPIPASWVERGTACPYYCSARTAATRSRIAIPCFLFAFADDRMLPSRFRCSAGHPEHPSTLSAVERRTRTRWGLVLRIVRWWFSGTYVLAGVGVLIAGPIMIGSGDYGGIYMMIGGPEIAALGWVIHPWGLQRLIQRRDRVLIPCDSKE
jgi:hypothetical protein